MRVPIQDDLSAGRNRKGGAFAAFPAFVRYRAIRRMAFPGSGPIFRSASGLS